MDVKLFLEQAYHISSEIAILETILKEARDRATRTTRNYDGSFVSGSRDLHKFDGLVSLEDEIMRQVNRLLQAQAEIVTAIDHLPNPVHRKLLLLRYIRYKSFPEVAAEIGYSERQMFRIHGAALSALTQKLKEKENESRC